MCVTILLKETALEEAQLYFLTNLMKKKMRRDQANTYTLLRTFQTLSYAIISFYEVDENIKYFYLWYSMLHSHAIWSASFYITAYIEMYTLIFSPLQLNNVYGVLAPLFFMFSSVKRNIVGNMLSKLIVGFYLLL